MEESFTKERYDQIKAHVETMGYTVVTKWRKGLKKIGLGEIVLEETQGMKKYYFTFGQIHTHSINGKTFDKDCVVEIEAESREEAREKMVEVFGIRWSHQYEKLPDMGFFPRGVFKI